MSGVSGWLAAGDAPEADWASYVLSLAMKDALGEADGLLLDLPALAQPYACRSSACAPGPRGPRIRSCCADLEVALTDEEAARVRGALDEVGAWMAARDDRWAAGRPEVMADGALTRPSGRCVFAYRHRGGLRCALHTVEDETRRARGSLKPMPCRLFPLVVVDLGEGRTLLTAVSSRTARKVGLHTAKAFPCLGGDASRTVAAEEKATLTELWGEATAAAIRRAVAAWARR